jgi:hypothetical protein
VKATMNPNEEELETRKEVKVLFDQVEEANLANPPEIEEEEDGEDSFTSLDDLDPEEELWPEGPTVAHIKNWKEEYGNVYITSVDVDTHLVWRKMQRPEYKHMLKVMEQYTSDGQMTNVDVSMFNEEYVTQLCTLFPVITQETLDTIDAGIPSIISQQVMDASGFVALQVREL